MPNNSGFKECIACAEEILVNAALCKHCKTRQDDPTFKRNPVIDQEATERLQGSDCPRCSEQAFVNEVCERCGYRAKRSSNAARKPKARWDQLVDSTDEKRIERTGKSRTRVSATSCSVCGRQDSVVKVRSIVSQGTSSGTAFTLGGTLQGLTSYFTTSSASQSGLASRLQPPPPEVRPSLLVIAFWIALGFAEATLLLHSFLFSGDNAPLAWIGSLVFSSPLGAVLGAIQFWLYIIFLKSQPEFQEARRSWQWRSSQILDFSYCSRDDVVFGENQKPKSPEAFFSTNYVSATGLKWVS